MEINLLPLNTKSVINIKDTYEFNQDDFKNTDIKKMTPIEIEGTIKKDAAEDFLINLNVKGIMTLPDSRTLKPVDFPFDIDIEESASENEENLKKNQKTIDILPIIWENILMEIPIRVIGEDSETIKTEGEGWTLIDDDHRPNTSLSKLKDLF